MLNLASRIRLLTPLVGLAVCTLVVPAMAQERAIVAEAPGGALITATEGTGLVAQGSGYTYGDDGVRGEHTGDGVVGYSSGPGDLDNGVIGFTDGGYGVYGFSNAGGQYGGYFGGPIFVQDGCTGCTVSLVARNTSDSDLRMGDVVRPAGVEAVAGRAHSPVVKVERAVSGEPTIGVVVGRTEVTNVEPGTDDMQPGPHFGPVGGVAEPGSYLVVTVQGLARVRAEPDLKLEPGEPVYAQKATTSTPTVAPPIGVAMDSVDDEGLVWTLVGVN